VDLPMQFAHERRPETRIRFAVRPPWIHWMRVANRRIDHPSGLDAMALASQQRRERKRRRLGARHNGKCAAIGLYGVVGPLLTLEGLATEITCEVHNERLASALFGGIE